eukprot:TRINITY_DN11902_c0_g1_i2.p1 TRINITY_DN11902_c0_g1~~TRINITY_DN11902_c0_g1_i2.p1  ORF type:complete len:381 (+),score=78.20 TRINITY_DN11902_c0_g1_i2:52-1143(+)
MASSRKAAVLGGGAFGSALATHLGSKGFRVSMWVLESEVCAGINFARENKIFLPGVRLNENIIATTSVEEAVQEAEFILLAIPTPFISRWVAQHQTLLPTDVPLVCCSKGIEMGTLRTPFEILVDELPGKYHRMLCVISGPSFAKEVATGLPTNVTCASKSGDVAERVQEALSSRHFRVYTAADVIGAELCGAIKNVLAIASGASDGLGLGANARAALISRGLAEMARLVVKKGGCSSTIMGLAGVGDLVLTCTGALSRNYTIGKQLGEGKGMDTGAAVAEGVSTSLAVHELAEKLEVDMPLCEAVYQVLHRGVEVQTALATLQDRPLRSEDGDVFASPLPFAHAPSVTRGGPILSSTGKAQA